MKSLNDTPSGGDLDVLYIFRHSVHDNFELRHSLRSLERHAPHIRKVWVYGDKPGFIADDTSFIEHIPYEVTSRVLGVKTPVANYFLLIFLSSLIPGLSSEYLLFSDDFFLLKDYPPAEARKDRYLEDMSVQPVRGRSAWKDSLWRTYDLLVRLGYPGYNFETHTPTFLTRKRVLAAYCDFQDFITEDRLYGMQGITAILNHAFKSEQMPLTNMAEEKSRFGFWGKPPAYEEVVQQGEGKTFFNFDDPAFGDGIRQFLAERFPRRSRYEKE